MGIFLVVVWFKVHTLPRLVYKFDLNTNLSGNAPKDSLEEAWCAAGGARLGVSEVMEANAPQKRLDLIGFNSSMLQVVSHDNRDYFFCLEIEESLPSNILCPAKTIL